MLPLNLHMPVHYIARWYDSSGEGRAGRQAASNAADTAWILFLCVSCRLIFVVYASSTLLDVECMSKADQCIMNCGNYLLHYAHGFAGIWLCYLEMCLCCVHVSRRLCVVYVCYVCHCVTRSPLIDICSVMPAWRTRGKVIRAVHWCVVDHSCTQS